MIIGLTQPPYDLFRIVYRLDAQVETITTIVRTIDDALGESLPTIEDEHQRDRLRAVAAPHGPGPAGETHFRASAGRVIPFKELRFESLPAFEVVLGSSCPMGPDDLGVLVLMEERLGARLTVRVSDVPVRT